MRFDEVDLNSGETKSWFLICIIIPFKLVSKYIIIMKFWFYWFGSRLNNFKILVFPQSQFNSRVCLTLTTVVFFNRHNVNETKTLPWETFKIGSQGLRNEVIICILYYYIYIIIFLGLNKKSDQRSEFQVRAATQSPAEKPISNSKIESALSHSKWFRMEHGTW